MSQVSSLNITSLSGGNDAIAWIDKQGLVHKLRAGDVFDIDILGNGIINLADPTDAQDAATKAYVDSHAGGGIANPLIADLDFNNHNALNVGEIIFVDTSTIADGVFTDATGSNYLSLNGTQDFHNGKNTGSHQDDINITSENGNVSLFALHDIDVNSSKIVNLLDPVNPQDAATRAYVLANAGGSQTPWTSDIDAAGWSLTDGGNSIQLKTGGDNSLVITENSGGDLELNAGGGDSITMSAGGVRIGITNSYLELFPSDANFGIHNGETAGVGSDVNLVSENGNIILTPVDGGGVGIGASAPTHDLEIYSATHSPFISLTYNGGAHGDFSAGMLFYNENGLNGAFTATANDYAGTAGISPNQCVFISFQAGGLLMDSRNGPLIFATSDTEYARINEDATGQFLVGATTDDGTGALIQSAGEISAAGAIRCGTMFSIGNSYDGQTEDVTVATDLLGTTTTLHFIGGIYIGRD